MRPVRKTKSTIPNLPPRPLSGVSQQSQKSNYKKKRMGEGMNDNSDLMDKLNGAFKTIDFNSEYDYMDNDSKLNDSYDMKSSQYSNRSFRNSTNTPLDGKNVLAKAKSLLEKQKSEIPALKEKQRKHKLKVSSQKDGAFLTGVNMYKEEIPDSPKKFEPEPNDNEEIQDEFNENDYLKDLILEEKRKQEDYSDMWRLINETKKEMCDYAEELYQLKNFTSDTNNELGGMGVRPERFWELDSGLENQMPNGNKNMIFKDKNALPSINTNSRKTLPKIQRSNSRNSLNTSKPKKSISSKQNIEPPRKKSIDKSVASSRAKPLSMADTRDKMF